MKLKVPVVALLLAASSTAYAAESTPTTQPSKADASKSDAMAKESMDDDEPLSVVPDRPTFSAAAVTVAAGHAQLEIGGEFATSDGASQLAFPVLARVGVAESLELRAGLPSFVIPLDEDTPSTLGSIQLGAKIAGDVTDSLSLGALPYFDIAANSGDETAFSQSTFGFALLWGFGLTENFGIAGNLGAAVGPGSTPDAGPRELFYSASLAAGFSSGAFGVTAEGFTILGQFAEPTVGGSLSAGYAVADTVIVDVYGGSSAQDGATSIFAGAGVTVAR